MRFFFDIGRSFQFFIFAFFLGINILVLAPTRELATQIHEEAGKFGSASGYHSACAYGGAPKRDQLREIQVSKRF